MIMLILGTFGIILVTTNIFYLPSLGFLAGPSPSSQSIYQTALREFISGGSVVEKNIKKKKNKDKTDERETNSNININSKGDASASSSLRKEQEEAKEVKVKTEKGKERTEEAKDSQIEKEKPPQKGPERATTKTKQPKIAGLNCDRFGGPSEEIAAEMVYWRDIPKDASFVSPYKKPPGGERQYLTFEPDEGGFNNIRMSMETATALAHAMGRILVLPPEQSMYLLSNDHNKTNNRFTFHKFFPFEAISEEHDAVEVISMEEFLTTEAMAGNLKDKEGNPSFPPNNATTFDGHLRNGQQSWKWLRTVATASTASFTNCVMVFPEKAGKEAVKSMQAIYDTMDMMKQNHRLPSQYRNNPRQVDSSTKERLHEILSFRKEICMYSEDMQNSKVMHFMGDNDSGARLLVHFYAFLFFEDWKQELWTKRYVRDHLRYVDAIQCGAASIVHAVRQKAIENGNPDGRYDSMHVRRGDFQYKQTRIPAEEILANIAERFTENSTVFIATDERNRTFFDPLREHYHLCFLDDFVHLLPEGFNKNYYGMLDQRIASRGRIFFGAYYSTFTGYINRMRGYHSQKDQSPGYLEGKLESYFYTPRENRDDMATYISLNGPLWGREFPTAWRDIDHNLESSHIVA